jgi:hypothetical protein
MPSIQIGNTAGLILQPNQSISQSPDGSGEGRLSYKTSWANIAAYLPTPLQSHPIFPDLKLYEFTIQREEGDIGRFDLIFRGVLAQNPQALAQEEFSLSATSEPIETHPLFAYPPESPPVSPAQIREIDNAIAQFREPNTGIVPDPSAAYTLYQKKIRGIDSWLRVGQTYKVSFCEDSIPTDYSEVGKIVINPGFNCPTPPAGQNYIFIGFSWRKAGGVVYVSKDFQLSGRGGWDQDLYE